VFPFIRDVRLLDQMRSVETLVHLTLGNDILAVPAAVKFITGRVELDGDAYGEP
jgi:hypothetical protein